MIVLQGQSLFDIALIAFGTPVAAFYIALANDLPVDAVLQPGQEIIVPKSAEEMNKLIADYYRNRNIKPATAATEEQRFDSSFDESFDISFY